MTRDEVVATHTGTELVVAFCGFAPGFPYCTGLPERLAVPRLDSPRTRVPAGSVGLAGPFTGVYPTASPGGWRLIGRTDLVLWDAGPGPAGDAGPRDAGAVRGHVRTLTVARRRAADHRAGPRPARAGRTSACPRSGALDRPAADAGEPAGRQRRRSAAVLETTLGGVALTRPRRRHCRGHRAPVRGPGRRPGGGVRRAGAAPAGARVGSAPRRGACGPTSRSPAASPCDAGARAPGRRTRSPYVGPPVLRDGDVLPLGEPGGAAGRRGRGPGAALPAAARCSGSAGPARRLVRRRRPHDADRVVVRRVGGLEPGRAAARGRARSREAGGRAAQRGDGARRGAGAADGQPLVFLADHPTTGGYPVVAVVRPGRPAGSARSCGRATEVRFTRR